MTLVSLKSNHLELQAICIGTSWVPEADAWNRIRNSARGASITISVAPVSGDDGRSVLAGASAVLNVDEHELLAPIAYLQLPVPFRTAKRYPQSAEWRKALVFDDQEPQVFMTNLPVCANCHAYSADGSTMLLDMDIDGDKGGFILADVQPEMSINRADCRSWNSLPPTLPSAFSFGLFARLSPDGNFAAATVGETSLFVMIDKDDYSQLFFPVTGQIGIYDRARNVFSHLPGTTNPNFVHSGPSFSPDGKRIAFSRAPVRPEYVQAVLNKTVEKESNDTSIHALNSRYPYRFDLCALPFPNPGAEAPKPLAGASNNGKSNYFPRYSPDGRWILFTQAPTGLVLQPESRLCVIPAAGGEARELQCNTPRMNSWHSWSPDGRWIAFSAKGQGPETEIFLSRFHENGQTSRAIRLHRLSRARHACVVPEFLPPAAEALQQAGLAFEHKTMVNEKNNTR
jgi:hypothetical protein